MPNRVVVAFLLVSAFLWGAGGGALADIECAKAQCEGKGKACVEALSVTYNACMAAGNRKCNSVPAAEKFNCLRGELSPCARTRNEAQAACLADMRSCHASCGPADGRQVHYWCVGDIDKGLTAAFCAVDAANSSPFDICTEALSGDGFQGSMTCEPL